MTEHHKIVLLTIEEAGSQVTVGYIAHKLRLPPAAVMQAGLELSHKKMVNNSSTLHIDNNGKEFRTYIYRIKPRGREMCQMLRCGQYKGDGRDGKDREGAG
jgi:hypothetical protein